MRNRDIFLPSLSTLLIFSMAMFLSCAHQNRNGDEALEAEAEQTEQSDEVAITEEGSEVQDIPQEAGQELAELSENTENQVSEASQSTDQALDSLTENTQKAAEDADLAALGIPQDSQTTQSIDTTANALSSDTASAEMEATKSASSLDPITGLEEGAAAGAVAAMSPLPSDETPAETTPPPAETIPSTPPLEEPAAFQPEERPREAIFARTSRVPKIPSKAVKRDGTPLNRFYFVREGDSPESVSNLVYGTPDHASDLRKWNGRGWTAGKIVYYASPVDPSEKKMRSFYQEKSVQPEEYTVERGDWLSKIAKKNLGSARSWKEIAVVNGMATPDSIEVGQKLAIYPKDLSGYSGKPQVAEPVVEEPKQEPVIAQQVPAQEQAIQPQAQVQPMDPNLEQNPIVPEPQQPIIQAPPSQKPEAVDASKLVEQNLPAVAILGLVVILSGLYLVVRKKKGSKSLDEFNDDNFAPPTKLKRK